MSGKGYQTLLECRRRGFLLRDRGFTVDQIAAVFSLDHDVTPLRLYRYSAGLTASQVVATFNIREASGAAPLRETRLYDYETWPSAGRRPPAWVLRLLAQIYGTHPARLLTAASFATYSRQDQNILRDCLAEEVVTEGTQRVTRHSVWPREVIEDEHAGDRNPARVSDTLVSTTKS